MVIVGLFQSLMFVVAVLLFSINVILVVYYIVAQCKCIAECRTFFPLGVYHSSSSNRVGSIGGSDLRFLAWGDPEAYDEVGVVD